MASPYESSLMRFPELFSTRKNKLHQGRYFILSLWMRSTAQKKKGAKLARLRDKLYYQERQIFPFPGTPWRRTAGHS